MERVDTRMPQNGNSYVRAPVLTDYSANNWIAWSLTCLRRLSPPLITAFSLYGLVVAFGERFSDPYAILLIISTLLASVLFRGTETENFGNQSPRGRVGSLLLSWIVLCGILLLIGYATQQSLIFSRRVLLSWFVVTPLLIAAGDYFISRARSRILQTSNGRRRAVIAGMSPIGQTLAEYIETDPGLGMSLLGFFDERPGEDEQRYSKYLGRIEGLVDYVKRNRVDVIYITLPAGNEQQLHGLVNELRDATASIYLVPDIFSFDPIQARVDQIHGIPVVALLETPFFGYSGLLKRFSDIVIASAILLCIWPLMLAIAVGVAWTTPGGIIFRQRRYGLAGEEIEVYKFRTMTVSEDGENIVQARPDDPRFTPFGAWLRRRSLDELPQFFNVLQGRMSVVGPRPHAVAQNEVYRKLINGYMVRHKVTPGITGLAQIHGCRGETREVEDMKRRIRYDLEYLRNWSLLLDMEIIVKTVRLLIRDPKAY